jgi:Flp pilus assembly protein TadD
MKKGTLLSVTSVLTALGVAFCVYQWPAYLRHKEARAMSRARTLLAAGDFANASLSARVALQLNPRNAEACCFMAQLAELAHSTAAIDWRRRQVEIAPTITNQLELAATALKFEGPAFPLAAQTLETAAPVAQDYPAFHVLSALVDLKANKTPDALEHFRKAARIEPANPMHRLNCAVLELQSPDAETAERAASELEQLTQHPHLQPLALRSLIADRIRRKDWSQAKQLSDRAIGLARSNFEDQLLRLTVLQGPWLEGAVGRAEKMLSLGFPAGRVPHESGSFNKHDSSISALGFDAYLAHIQTSASSNALQVYGLCEWMGGHGLAAEALEWLNRLDASLCKAQPIPFAAANLYAAMADWPGLEEFLNGPNWQEMEFLRQAFLARAAWGQGGDPAGDARWRCAVRSAGNRLGALLFLLRLSEEWNKDPEEVLLGIWRGFPREKWAIEQLEAHYRSTGNTRGLNRIYTSRMDAFEPRCDVTNRNDFVCTSLLLGIHLPRAHDLARQLHDENPNDVILASTYAFSLQLQGKTNQAREVFARFDKQSLEQPAVALYYGLLLAKTGEGQLARQYLAAAEQVKLSPEETQLLQDAKRALP